MPRYKPPTQRAKQDERQKLRQAAEPDSRLIAAATLLEEVRVERGMPITTRDRDVYGPQSEHSYFRDLAVVAAADSQRDWMPTPAHEGARERLATVETRTLSTTATAGGNFVPPGPSYLGDEFATAARAASVMTTILPRNELPPKGIFSLTAPRITTGGSVAIQQTQNSAVSNTDPVESMVANPVATISGMVDMSQQLLDHSQPGMDIVLAADLGKAYGAQVDSQILRGIGSAGQMLGLGLVSGITTDLYSDISATQAEAFPVIAKLYADVATALGIPRTRS